MHLILKLISFEATCSTFSKSIAVDNMDGMVEDVRGNEQQYGAPEYKLVSTCTRLLYNMSM